MFYPLFESRSSKPSCLALALQRRIEQLNLLASVDQKYFMPIKFDELQSIAQPEQCSLMEKLQLKSCRVEFDLLVV